MAVDFLHGMRIGSGERSAELVQHARFHGGGDAFGIFQMTVRDQPAGTLGDGAADEPYEDRTHRTDQDDPAPAFQAERVARYQHPSQQGDHGNHAELYDLVYSESTTAKMFGHEFSDVSINGHQFNADADAGDYAPGDDANRCVLEGHDDGSSRIPQQGAGEDDAPTEPIRCEPEEHRTDKEPREGSGDKTSEAVEPEERRGGTGE